MPQPDVLRQARRCLAEAAEAVLGEVASDGGVGVTMLLADGPAYGGANPFTERIDAVQYALMEGPCVSAAESGELVRFHAHDVDERRWPRFTKEAGSLSLHDAVSVPLLDQTRVIGSLNLYSCTRDGFCDLTEADAVRLAAQVQPAVRNSRTLVVAATNALLLRQAAHDRADIERGANGAPRSGRRRAGPLRPDQPPRGRW